VEQNLIAEYTTVPEPTTWAMMLGGSGLLLAFNRYRRA
jgi:hypothetical protein